MSCQTAIEHLPWLWNGSLEDAEERLLREHLAICGECRREAGETAQAWEMLTQHVPSLALAEYAHGLPPSGLDREVIERHLASCPSCRQELKWATADRIADFAAARQARADSAARPRRGSEADGPVRTLRWRWIAAAASLAALAVSGGLIRSFGERDAAAPREVAEAAAPAAEAPAAPAWQTGSSGIFGDGFESGDTLVWRAHSEAPSDDS